MSPGIRGGGQDCGPVGWVAGVKADASCRLAPRFGTNSAAQDDSGRTTESRNSSVLITDVLFRRRARQHSSEHFLGDPRGMFQTMARGTMTLTPSPSPSRHEPSAKERGEAPFDPQGSSVEAVVL